LRSSSLRDFFINLIVMLNFSKKIKNFKISPQWVYIILFSLVFLRMIFLYAQLQDFNNIFLGDGKDYQCYAMQIKYDGIFSDYEPKFPLGYPLYLSFIYRIFGNNYQAVFISQIFLYGFTVWIIFLLGKEIFQSFTIASLASLFFFCEIPIDIIYLAFHSEALLTLILVLAFFLLFRAFRKNNILLFAFSGLFIGISALIKSAYELLFLFLIFVFAFVNKDQTFKKMLYFGVLLIMMMLVTGVGKARNLYYWGNFELASNQGHCLLHCVLPEAIALDEHATYYDVKARQESMNIGNIQNPFLRSEKYTSLAIRYILTHPKVFLKAVGKGTYRFFFHPGYILWNCFQYVFIVLGFFFAFVRGDHRQKLFALCVLFMLIGIILGCSTRGWYRHRFPLMPFFAIISAKGFAAIFEKNKRRKEETDP